jgi:hypothetical protein
LLEESEENERMGRWSVQYTILSLSLGVGVLRLQVEDNLRPHVKVNSSPGFDYSCRRAPF